MSSLVEALTPSVVVFGTGALRDNLGYIGPERQRPDLIHEKTQREAAGPQASKSPQQGLIQPCESGFLPSLDGCVVVP